MSSVPTNLNDSVLGKLPLELRRMVYRACFDNTDQNVIATRFSNTLLSSISPAILTTNMRTLLAPLQVSSQMRRKAIDLLLGDKTAIIYRNMANDTVNSPMIYLSAQQIASWGFTINMIPIHLRSPRLTYELRHDCLMDGDVDQFPPLTGTEFARSIDRLVTVMQPCELVLSVNFAYHKIAACRSSKSYHVQGIAAGGSLTFVCSRDEPMNSQDCEHMVVKFSARDVVKARRQVAEAFAEKRRQLEVHRAHKICFIRTSGLDTALAALATAEGMVNAMIGHLTPASMRYRAAGLLG
jgi:hypothetical protein